MDKDILEICINRQKKMNFSHKHLTEKSSGEEKNAPWEKYYLLGPGEFLIILRILEF